MNREVSDSITVSDSVTIQARSYFSIQHIQSAAHFARESAQIEKSYNGTLPGDLLMRNKAYAAGAILAAVAFLEAGINEIFLDAVDKAHGIRTLDANIIELLANTWHYGEIDRLKVLNKYQVALALAKKPLFDTGQLPYQDVALLIGLRNNLVHYKPKTVTVVSDVEEVTVDKLEEKVRNKFALNPFVPESNPFFPDRCLGHGCAAWAVASSLKFSDEFFSRIGLKPTYDHVRSYLNTNKISAS